MVDPGSVQASTGQYREFIPDLNQPRFQIMKMQDAHEYALDFKTQHIPPWLYALYEHWMNLYQEPFKGITTDGHVRPGLFTLQDEGIPIEKIVGAAQHLLAIISQSQRLSLCYHVDSPEWRTWSNPEFLLHNKGLRLDEVDESIRTAILDVLKASLSAEGYEKAIKAMRINHFLGELVESPRVMNEYSYNFVLFGQPSTTRPWGWSFYGHHLCLNVFFYQHQIVISPWFTGAEPNEIDSGPYQGTRILHIEEALGLQLMQSLSPELQSQAQIYLKMHDEAMPPGRWNKDDQRHLCGASRDNRMIPYEGILLTQLTADQKEIIYAILRQYLLYLPEKSREMKLAHIQKFETETFFSWIGGFGDDDPFYYRIQSPVIIAEFDHHSGVFLTNQEPKKFHIHSILRTPNGGDYGFALRPLIPAIEGIAGKEIVW